MSFYAANGSMNVTVVPGTSYTGYYAADGSVNVIKSPGTGFVGAFHACGAQYVTVAPASTLVPLRAPDGSLYVSVAAGPSVNNGQPITVVSGSLGSTFPLDGLTTGIKAAYSTRRLLTAYAGKSMNVIRASDSTTLDIGFVAGVLDTASLATFCSGTTGSINIWYDQSGGGFNLIPGIAAPVIYASGAVKTINSKPAPSFTAASFQYLKNTSLASNPVNTLYENFVTVANSFSTAWAIRGTLSSGYVLEVSPTTGTIASVNAGVGGIGTSSNSLTATVGSVVEVQYNSVSGAFSFWVDRASGGTGTVPQTLGADTIQLGAYANAASLAYDGFIGEYISYDLVGGIPGASQTSITLNQKAYWGTP